MKYCRYGKFSFKDYYSVWLGVIFLITIGIVSAVFDVHSFLIFFEIVFMLFLLWSVCVPFRERFCLCYNMLKVEKGKKSKEIPIPSELTLIMSYADVCSPFAKRMGLINQTYILKGKYSLSLLKKMPLEYVLERLHGGHVRKYTTSIIESDFENFGFIYSFVCDQDLLEQVLQNRDYILIIPESFSQEFSMSFQETNIYIDIGY